MSAEEAGRTPDQGAGCRSVTCLLSRRAERREEDGRTLALVLPGGGMLGAWQAGLLAEIAREGLSDAFDLVVGCSAGAINGVYFTGGQAEDCLHAYTSVLPGRRFINPVRVWRMMDIDFLIDEVVCGSVPLDVGAVRESRTGAHIVLTELSTGEARLFDGRHSEIMEILRATAAAPVVYGRAPAVDGVRYMDGGLSSPFPVREARALGATDVVVAAPHPRGRRWRRQTGAADAALAGWCHLRSRQAGVMTYRRAPDRFDAGMRLCEDPPDRTMVSILPAEAPEAHGFTSRDPYSAALVAAAGASDLRRFLDTLGVCEAGCRT